MSKTVISARRLNCTASKGFPRSYLTCEQIDEWICEDRGLITQIAKNRCSYRCISANSCGFKIIIGGAAAEAADIFSRSIMEPILSLSGLRAIASC